MKKITYYFLGISLLSQLLACSPFGNVDPISESDIADILQLDFALDSSGTEKLIHLKARIRPEVEKAADRVIIFKTDRGKFLTNEENKQEISITANSAGTAAATLKTEYQGGLFLVSAELKIAGDIKQTIAINVSPPAENTIFNFSLDDPLSYFADGVSVIRFSAQIPSGFKHNEEKTVIFKHNIKGGKFQNSVTDNELRVTISGTTAGGTLQVGTTPGPYTLTAGLSPVNYSRSIPLTLGAISPEDVIQVISVDSAGLLADGTSEVHILLKIANSPVSQIQLEKNHGALLVENAAAIPLNPNGEIDFRFRISNEPVPHSITATVAHSPPLFRTIYLKPKPAWPDTIFLTADKYTIDRQAIGRETIILKTHLSRQHGLPSTGTKVAFRAFQRLENGSTQIVGSFENTFEAISLANGELPAITFRFSNVAALDLLKPVYLQAYIPDREAVSTPITINIK